MKQYLYTFELYRLNVLTQTWHQTTWEGGPLTKDGQQYEQAIIRHGAVALSAEKSAGNLEVSVLRDHPVAQRFLTGYPDGRIRLLIHEREEDGSGLRLTYAGLVRAASFDEAEAKLQCADTLAQLQVPTPRLKYAPPCPWPLYGADCGVDRNAHKSTGTVTAVSADGLTLTTTLVGLEVDRFAAGLLEANGQSRMVTQSDAAGVLHLFAAIDGLKAGDAITAYRGCNRSIAHCRERFNNHLNYGGQHLTPVKNLFYTGLTA